MVLGMSVRAQRGATGGRRSRGSLVISIDAELGWGVHDLRSLPETWKRRVAASRQAWLQLLELFETYRIPATWAIVGHLLVADGQQFHDRHPLSGDWFEQARHGLAESPSRWVGSDLVEAIRSSSVEHEIGSHSFSHVVFDEVTEEVARAECQFAREVGQLHGYDFRSFVFPRNAVAHVSALSEAGFECFRGHPPPRLPAIPGLRGGALLAGAVTGLFGPPLVSPTTTDEGLVNVPASMFLGGYRGNLSSVLATVDDDPAVRLAKQGIDRACDTQGLLHLWLHPGDLTDNAYIRRVRRVLSYAARQRDSRDLRIEKMGDVARRVTSRGIHA